MNRRCVLHAALALASGHESAMLAAPDRSHSTSSASAQERFSLQQYNKAIACLMPLLGTEEGDATDMILIVCLLFSCLELLNGHYKTGQVHLQAAFELARKGLATHKSATANSTFAWLSEVVGRLALQSYLLESNALKLQNMEALQHLSMPTSSASLNRARLPMDKLLHGAYTLRQWELDNPSPTDTVAKEWLMTAKRATQSELDSWPSLYLPHEQDGGGRLSLRELLGFQILRIYHTVAQILVGSVGNDLDECVFDDYTSHFECILDGTADILVASEAMRYQDVAAGLNSQSLNFTIDLGLIPPVYFTALKCRVPRVRRRAIALLAHSLHQEGIWNGKLAAIVSEKVMDIEESLINRNGFQNSNHLCRNGSQESVVPGDLRIVDVHAELPNLPHGVLVMECRQRSTSGGWDTIRKSYNLKAETWDA
ncbi:hypothetical protein NQ176_g9845 [Zarea fungicola]|uniref:Uncharacterized protein n=1 Tax=Zarea fungicola TaxID=93591 RepID=A0ACC1MJV7_9HYPO|nr:hypothetical protein NQ176_g9845 [Lecanicillium fungicola]